MWQKDIFNTWKRERERVGVSTADLYDVVCLTFPKLPFTMIYNAYKVFCRLCSMLYNNIEVFVYISFALFSLFLFCYFRLFSFSVIPSLLPISLFLSHPAPSWCPPWCLSLSQHYRTAIYTPTAIRFAYVPLNCIYGLWKSNAFPTRRQTKGWPIVEILCKRGKNCLCHFMFEMKKDADVADKEQQRGRERERPKCGQPKRFIRVYKLHM